MMLKFREDLRALKQRVKRCEVRGTWRYIAASGQHQFKAETGENLNWWPSTGTITFQGGDDPVLKDCYELRYGSGEAREAAMAYRKTNLRRR